MIVETEKLAQHQATIVARHQRNLEDALRTARPAMTKLVEAYLSAGTAMVKGLAEAMARNNARRS